MGDVEGEIRGEEGDENLSGMEVEAVLYAHPALNKVAVVARPNEFLGDMSCAFVRLMGGLVAPPSEKVVVRFC